MVEINRRRDIRVGPREKTPEERAAIWAQQRSELSDAIRSSIDVEQQFFDTYGKVLGSLSISWMRAENNLTLYDGRRVSVDDEFLGNLGMALAEQVNSVPEEDRGKFLGQYLQDCRQFKH